MLRACLAYMRMLRRHLQTRSEASNKQGQRGGGRDRVRKREMQQRENVHPVQGSSQHRLIIIITVPANIVVIEIR